MWCEPAAYQKSHELSHVGNLLISSNSIHFRTFSFFFLFETHVFFIIIAFCLFDLNFLLLLFFLSSFLFFSFFEKMAAIVKRVSDPTLLRAAFAMVAGGFVAAVASYAFGTTQSPAITHNYPWTPAQKPQQEVNGTPGGPKKRLEDLKGWRAIWHLPQNKILAKTVLSVFLFIVLLVKILLYLSNIME